MSNSMMEGLVKPTLRMATTDPGSQKWAVIEVYEEEDGSKTAVVLDSVGTHIYEGPVELEGW